MRDTEFKVYDKNRRKVDNPVFFDGNWFANPRDMEDYIPMKDPIVFQYTGLTIEGNRKLFEGDLIKGFEINGIHGLCMVEYLESCFVVRLQGIGLTRPLFEVSSWNIEFVANLEENKELL